MDPTSANHPESKRKERSQNPRTKVAVKLKIVLWLNDVPVSTGGLVVTRDLQVGNGIKFIDLATEERLTLKRFLAVAGNPQSPESTNQTGPGQKRNRLESP
jgi:hypothetical protein